MSKMNELATVLDDLTAATNQLKTCAQDLITSATRLRGLFETDDSEETKPTKNKPDARKAPEQPEPAPEPPVIEPPADPPTPAYTREQIRGMLSDLAGTGHREEAKALVNRYSNGGSFSDIDPASYPELAQEVRKIHA